MSEEIIKSSTTSITADAVAAHTAKFAPPVVPVTVAPSEYEGLYEQQREENARLSAIIASSRISSTPSQPSSDKPAVTAERVKALVGQVGMLKMSRAEKLTALGVDPNTSDDLLRQLFSRAQDGKTGPDLMKTDRKKYFLLRKASKILNLYAA